MKREIGINAGDGNGNRMQRSKTLLALCSLGKRNVFMRVSDTLLTQR